MQTALLIRGDVPPPRWQEAVRHSLQTEHGASLGKLRQEAEEQLRRAEKDREELQDELRSLQHERDQSLLQAETEKQQVRSASEPPSPTPALPLFIIRSLKPQSLKKVHVRECLLVGEVNEHPYSLYTVVQ